MSLDSAICVTLEIFSGPGQGQTFVFNKAGRYLFGSIDEADIQVSGNSFVSRHHFYLEITPRVCKICDVSTNGTFVNGIRYGGKKAAPANVPQAPGGISEVELQSQDKIKIGQTKMRISLKSKAIPLQIGMEKRTLAKTINMKDYSIEREIGKSYSGITYKALKISSRQTVVLKKLAHAPESTKEFEAYLELSHPNIARLLDWGYCEEACYLVREFVVGEDIYRLCKMTPKGYLELVQVKSVMLQMLEALAFAHTQSALHGNLKPQNIFLAQEHKKVKLADFGITTRPDPESIGMLPLYWPRERILQYPICAPTDVFAIAAIFYEMLTGSWLRDGFKDMFSLCRKQGRKPGLNHYMQVILSNPAIPIREKNPDIPKATAVVIDHALAETVPEDQDQAIEILGKIRYPDAGTFCKVLAESFTQ